MALRHTIDTDTGYKAILTFLILVLLGITKEGVAQVHRNTDKPRFQWIVEGKKVKVPIPIKQLFTADTLSLSQGRSTVKTRILEYYYGNGFLSARIDSLRDIAPEGRSRIYAEIRKGCHYKINKIEIHGVRQGDQDAIDLFFPQGEPYDRHRLEVGIDRTIRYFEKEGYPLVQVKVANFKRYPRECRVDIQLELETGKKMRADGLMLPSLDNVDSDYIRKASGVADSALITPNLITSVRQRLQNTGFFQRVGEPEIVVKNNRNYLQIPLEEQNPNMFDLVLGYVPNSGGGGTFVGDGQLRLRNIFWPGSTTYLQFERQRRLVTKLNIGFQRDWILGVPLGARIDFRFLQQDTAYQVRNITLTGSYDIDASTSLSGKLRRKVTAGNQSLQSSVDALDAESIYGGIGITYRQLDDRINPTEGMQLSAEILTGVKSITDEQAGQKGIATRVSQKILEFDIQPYVSLIPRHVLTPSLHGYFLNASQMTESDLLRFGGAQSLRGYREDQFRASRLVWGDLEYRYLLDPTTYGFIFGATGYYHRPQLITESTDERETTEWLYSWGIGFSYKTAIGRLKLSYALSPKESLNNGKVHFGIVGSL